MLQEAFFKFIMAVINGLIAAILLYAALILKNKILPVQSLFGFGYAAAFVILVKLIWIALTGFLFSLIYFFLPARSEEFSSITVFFAFLSAAIDLWFFIALLFDWQPSAKNDYLSGLMDLIITGAVFAAVFIIVKFTKAHFFQIN